MNSKPAPPVTACFSTAATGVALYLFCLLLVLLLEL